MNEDDRNIRPGSMAVGMILGALIGFVLWMATDIFVFMPAFLGVGLTLALVIDGVRRA